ncbi:hypothetical protein H4R99_000427 [Coemansia sp. RSA 1722]|nr:hypothetical protein IWW45_003129 [Coemansia sp. RSA 485]KAJ2606406.1 hypothetical protein H4R99_000427 [Coemansia sp. RSA 1722]KAJ2635915.1 hypothetical protein GGF40_003312 [Coemansia sp. RSA 1286]
MPLFNMWQSSAATATATTLPAAVIKIHPQTTQVVLERNVESHNLLVGYVSITVTRPLDITTLAVSLTGDQQLDIRQGEGPSATQYSIRNRCLDITHTLLDTSERSAASVLDMARIHNSQELLPPAYYGDTQEASSGLVPGEYRFAFEFAVPEDELPASVTSRLGNVSYTLNASVRRPGWLSNNLAAQPVGINIVQAPSTYLASPCMRAAAFGLFLGDSAPSLNALTTLPLVLDLRVSDRWKVSVYMVSRAMKLGMQSKIQAYVTRIHSSTEEHGAVHVVGLGAQLTENITHRVPGTPSTTRTRSVVARANGSVVSAVQAPNKPSKGLVVEPEQFLDARTIDCLGESLDGVVLPGSASLGLTPEPLGRAAGGVQPSSCSDVFSVSHDLDVVVDLRGVEEGKVCRVTLSSPVVVLPEVLLPNMAVSSLPSYKDVANDLVLASSLADCFCAPANPLCPPPPTYV